MEALSNGVLEIGTGNWSLDIWRCGIADRVREPKRVTAVQQHGHTRNMQRFGNAMRHRLQQWSGFNNRPDLVRQLGENLLGIVGFAEESPIDPGSQFDGELPNNRNCQYAGGDELDSLGSGQ